MDFDDLGTFYNLATGAAINTFGGYRQTTEGRSKKRSYLDEVFWMGGSGKWDFDQTGGNIWNDKGYKRSNFQSAAYAFSDKAPIGMAAASATPFIAGAGAVYGSAAIAAINAYAPAALAFANKKSIEYYVIGSMRINGAYQSIVNTAAGYIGKNYGWHVLFHPSVQAILKSAEKGIDPQKIIKLLEKVIRKGLDD